jgi:hypothetical protein
MSDDEPDDELYEDPDDVATEACTCPITTVVLGFHEDGCPSREYFEQQRLDDERRAANRQPTVRHWVERAHDFDGRPLPRPGDVVRARQLASSGPDGHQYDHYTGTVLWLDAFYDVTETHYRDDNGNVTDISTQRRPRMSLQLADGRTATLNGHEFEGVWQVLDDADLAEIEHLVAESDRLRADAEAGGARALRRAADELYAATGLADPEQIACYPDRVRGPQKPTFRWLLDQGEQWWPAGRGPVALADMGPRHRRHLREWLMRRAPSAHVQDAWIAAGAPDDVWQSYVDEDPREWMARRPLLRALDALIAADTAAGVPDEAPPTEAELARWRRYSGRAADGSEDRVPEEELWERRRAAAATITEDVADVPEG